MTQEQVAVTAEKIRAGKTSLGIEFGSTDAGRACIEKSGYVAVQD